MGPVEITVGELASKLGGKVVGESSAVLRGVNSLEEGVEGDIAFFSNKKYEKMLQTTRATAVLVPPQIKEASANLIQVDDPYFAFREVMILFYGFRRQPPPGISDKAVIGQNVSLGKDVAICPNATISDEAVIGDRTVVYPGCWIGPRAKIGADCQLYPNVVIYEDCILGDRVILHAGCSIGQDGFGHATHNGAHHKIPQVGIVVIEDDVEMGANCAVDRATIGQTVIGKGTKFSDLVVVAHGTKVGKHCLLVAQVGIAGSVDVGDYCVFGGQAGIVGHLKIGDRSQIGAQAGVTRDFPPDSVVLGSPAEPIHLARRGLPLIGRLGEMFKRLRKIEKQLGIPNKSRKSD
jgi:UDP-3-O-[3-hydroxymyristoyl] glucosamine N-acyltransferase